MGKANYWASGFQLLTELSGESGLLSYGVANGVAISVGDMLAFASGYVQRATTFAAVSSGTLLAGISLDFNATGDASSAGVVTSRVIKLSPCNRFIVPVGSATKITQAAVGTAINMYSGTPGKIDLSGTMTIGYAFIVEAIDASAAAVAVNAAGYAIGHFEFIAAN